jgi:hypothetical protein
MPASLSIIQFEKSKPRTLPNREAFRNRAEKIARAASEIRTISQKGLSP